ncbi:MAG: hypothetical protein AVO34_02775 [Firmicutes bacterium ML8_F2]|jgi:two-component system, OmpR family, alkaline phosphatase synthesis response regulator PhoP|nr:MAG: hypothetical protein AVO34_02775 [Firmicutes bacterium ML8_F2]
MNNDLDRKQRFILIVEDEEDIVRLLTFHLEKEGFRTYSVGSGPAALDYALQNIPDLIILDIMLPEMDGLEVCRRLRSSPLTAVVPILILSARREELDKVLGLELGADDYMVKPFSIRELVARVRAMLRRLDQNRMSEEVTPELKPIRIGPIVLNPERYEVTVKNEQQALTHKEFILLQLLMANAGKVLTRETLLDKIWGYETGVDTRTVDVHIRSLRRKLEEDPSRPCYIETVRGVGYRFADR